MPKFFSSVRVGMKPVAFAILAYAGLMAGEYDRVSFGPKLHIGWSPSKDYAIAGGNGVAPDMIGERQLSVIAGIEVRMNPIPGRFAMALDADYIKTLNVESGRKDNPVDQDGIRGTFRFILSRHGNTEPGIYYWVGPSVIHGKTRTDVYDVLPISIRPPEKETFHGFGAGIGSRRFGETSQTFMEANIFRMSDSKAGSRFGGLTLELGFGVQF